ncbi:acrosin-binding protein isoform X2 [Sphaerodactylus townsendi]|uniref:acrosin-binding protein isoform X2 n=1 Tax=Sphaerodactylus townsendi TaxID=933632 RepID=UPI00202653D6|nr:acrosin-binding protein isoform X2 [Sphaerodactylus townsendi]
MKAFDSTCVMFFCNHVHSCIRPKLFKGRHQENKKAKTGGSTQEQKGVMEELSEQIIAQPAANNWKNPGFPFFLSQLIPRTLSSDPGSPLTEDEYEVFFSALRPEWKASMMCQTRRSKGCQSPKIKQLDEFENHGQIPEGPICADLPQIQRFETFCLFAQFRCLDQKFYIKRIMCPIAGAEETTSISAETAQLLDLLETSVKPTEESAPHTEAQVSSPPDGKELLSDIDTLLKYSFAVSGQEPEPQEDFPTVTASEGVLQAPVHEDHPHQPKAISDTDAQETEEIKETDQPIPTIIHHSESTDFPSEEVESTEAAEGTRELHVQEDPPGTESKGRLLDLEKDDAVLILCFAVLEDICVSSVVSKAWKEMEDKILGYGSLVCDSLGRRHTDLCPMCAFCSLKMEQCQRASDLRRVHCESSAKYTAYINPGIGSQYQDTGTKVSSPEVEYYGMDVYGGYKADHWCGRLATHGCDDPRVYLWLQTEYSFFQQGDYPDKISCFFPGL